MFALRVGRRAGLANSEAKRRVLLVSQDETFRLRHREAFARRPDFLVTEIAGVSFEAVAQVKPGPDVVLIDLESDRAAATGVIERCGINALPAAIIAFSETLDEAGLRSLLRAGVKDWLQRDADAESVLKACDTAVSRPSAERNGGLACFAFVPAAGGVGNTTIALETAFLLGRRGRSLHRTCVIDLNFQSGALADHLGVTSAVDVKSLVSDPGRLDSRLLDAMLARHTSGLAVLAAPRSPATHLDIETRFVVQLLDMASQIFDTLIIDMPPMWTPYCDPVVAGCDRVFVITEPSVPALRRARDIAEALPDKLPEDARVRVIINKWRREFLGAALSRRDAEVALNGFLAGFIPEDATLVRDAINRGDLLSATSWSNKISRELARIVAVEAPQELAHA